MNRRSFLRGLLALPCSVGLLARSLALQAGEASSIPAPSTTSPSLLDYAKAHPMPAVVESTPWASGSDYTSIWLIGGDENWRIPPDAPEVETLSFLDKPLHVHKEI